MSIHAKRLGLPTQVLQDVNPIHAAQIRFQVSCARVEGATALRGRDSVETLAAGEWSSDDVGLDRDGRGKVGQGQPLARGEGVAVLDGVGLAGLGHEGEVKMISDDLAPVNSWEGKVFQS